MVRAFGFGIAGDDRPRGCHCDIETGAAPCLWCMADMVRQKTIDEAVAVIKCMSPHYIGDHIAKKVQIELDAQLKASTPELNF